MRRNRWLLLAVPCVLFATAALAADDDADGISNDQDNCVEAANADQCDTDGDGFGNACDGDLDNDGAVTDVDRDLFNTAFGLGTLADGADPGADSDCDGTVGIVPDMKQFRAQAARGAPGPSGVR
jgi:hypothetical protein